MRSARGDGSRLGHSHGGHGAGSGRSRCAGRSGSSSGNSSGGCTNLRLDGSVESSSHSIQPNDKISEPREVKSEERQDGNTYVNLAEKACWGNCVLVASINFKEVKRMKLRGETRSGTDTYVR